jgi:hypothetical protein
MMTISMVGVLGDMSPDWLVYYLIDVFLNYLLKRYRYQRDY